MSTLRCVVVHSGGMDSSICLKLAIDEFGSDHVVSLGMDYRSRHNVELVAAEKIARAWGVHREVIDAKIIQELTSNALVDPSIAINGPGKPINTLVAGRNGLMCWFAALYAARRGCSLLSTGVMGLEGANSGYRDCSRSYMNRLEAILRIDLDDPHFQIRTPLVDMDKCQTLELADRLGVLDFLLENTITCYEGLFGRGCKSCPACRLRNEGIDTFMKKYPERSLPRPVRS